MGQNWNLTRKKLCRSLGLIETMHHVYYSRGTDMYAQMIKLKCSKPVSRTDIEYALQCLTRKHPLLRMYIRDRGKGHETEERYFFQEMDNFDVSFDDIYAEDNEIILRKATERVFDFNGPLWRLSRVRTTPEAEIERNYLQIMFAFHHAIVDGVYLGILIADFIEFLDLVQRGLLRIQDVKVISLMPAIEHLIQIDVASQKCKELERVIPSESEQTKGIPHEALTVYEKCFQPEITMLSAEKKQTSAFRIPVSSRESSRFISECKQRRCTVTGASIAAATRSFGLLVKPHLPNDIQLLDVLVEVMVDLRRYLKNNELFKFYPGTAVIHVPITVRISLKEDLCSPDMFWYLARQCSDELRNIIASCEPVRQLASETREEINAPIRSGKSKYVIFLTNRSQIDNIIKPEQKARFALQGFPGIANIAMDDMPIFYIAMHTMRGELHFDVFHCAGYTSSQTSSKFCKELVRAVNHKSKL